MEPSLTSLTNAFQENCGGIYCQGNAISALGESAGYLALESLCSAVETKFCDSKLSRESEAYFGDATQYLTSAHTFARNSQETLDLLRDLNTQPAYYCVAVCILNPRAIQVTYESRFLVVKGESDDAAFTLQAYRREDLDVFQRPNTKSVSITQLVANLETLLSNNSNETTKRRAYAAICCIDEAVLEPVLRTVDWNKFEPTLVGVGFQGSGAGIDGFIKEYQKAKAAQRK